MAFSPSHSGNNHPLHGLRLAKSPPASPDCAHSWSNPPLHGLRLAKPPPALPMPLPFTSALRQSSPASYEARRTAATPLSGYVSPRPFLNIDDLRASHPQWTVACGRLPTTHREPAGSEPVHRQTFAIRSHEVWFDGTAPISTIANLFLETSLDHLKSQRISRDATGATHAMIRNRLIWVMTKMCVEMMQYPAWGDTVRIDSWTNSSGRNGVRRDFILWEHTTGRLLGRAMSTWAIMNRDTRKLSKMPEEVLAEMSPLFRECSAMDKEHDAIERVGCCDESAPFRAIGLTSKVQDLDMNLHVNHVKYIDWVMECIPESIFMGFQLSKLALEFRRECGKTDIIDSFAQPDMAGKHDDSFGLLHSLRFCNSAVEVLRSHTQWVPRKQCH